VIVGVNRYRLAEEEEHDILEVDNAKVRAGQIARLEKMRAGRDEAKVRRRWMRWSRARAAKNRPQPAR
jgi:methylmalonyl-CoA mutase